ncbi:MAG: CoB--CoM heterodisulfide reductase iron-sulfur subunit A family protein [Gammaproteobacteria bacterium]|jgi:quinone-modifying oxidoreductase subunit QmoA|nr:CoB--CoM heterodisulfide reductase iron-sulfur subunit A family protein [Gammaproteobacteria bacterium]MBT4196523.1 CoB--CoM heterodisulfide reductase iron-sulfur subunit A family protein [Gammaproteobacteria bacterium]MBT4450209.1 CoB--CoM heterodisulfide reductase iron-sulfur subunit A family protein [Gammaproteobacteria bacterium]MBT4861680.1 CoB--CoM heterodisulfide reductase iron-sulfur subunit A family protein [Gammaproteobacteria bacterium]MBT6454665.1 CoB--CoM heterodisulfide reducta
MTEVVATNQTILVVGAGISGITAAVEAAETGKNVVLVEKRAYMGGRISQLYKYFPKLCFPSCGLEINQRRLSAQGGITVLTMAEVSGVTGSEGDYTATVKISPRYVNENCTACGACGDAVEAEFDNDHNYGLDKHKGAYLPYNMAKPERFVIDPRIIGTDDAEKAKAACKYDAIDLDMQEETIEFKAGAIIWATGWTPYDANKIQPYGYDRYDNVITSVEFERMMDKFGPTGGKIIRPGDGKEAKDIAFIQCAGSRDRNHLKHCSRICCMASLKQSTYITEQYGAEDEDAKGTIYYIDIRSIDRFEDFYRKVQNDPKISFVKSKVANIIVDKENNPVVKGVDTEGYHRYETKHDLVVLAVGMEPNVTKESFPVEIAINEHGFIEADEANGGIFAAGCASDALDVNRAVQSATAAALRAVQVVNKVAGAEG